MLRERGVAQRNEVGGTAHADADGDDIVLVVQAARGLVDLRDARHVVEAVVDVRSQDRVPHDHLVALVGDVRGRREVPEAALGGAADRDRDDVRLIVEAAGALVDLRDARVPVEGSVDPAEVDDVGQVDDVVDVALYHDHVRGIAAVDLSDRRRPLQARAAGGEAEADL